MKNLDLVLTAMRELNRPSEFDIYGPLEDALYWIKCQRLISELPAHVRVTYAGELAPADVRDAFHNYDAFVFPTLGESFGYVIAESLSASCPVLCSDMTPWGEVLEAGGGAVVDPLTANRLASELNRYAAFTDAERMAVKRAAGRAYRAWRQDATGPNILDQMREAEWSARR